MTTVVQTKNLTKTYAMGEMQVQALDCVDFFVSAGEFVAIIGKSGSGKIDFYRLNKYYHFQIKL